MAARLTHQTEANIVSALVVNPVVRDIAKQHGVAINSVRKIYECLRRTGYYKDHVAGRPVPPLMAAARSKYSGRKLGKLSYALIEILSTRANVTPGEMQSLLIQRDIRTNKANLYQTLTRLRQQGLLTSESRGFYSLPSSEQLAE